MLKACSESPTIKRVVLTSSVVAIYGMYHIYYSFGNFNYLFLFAILDASSVLPKQFEEKNEFDENDWTFIDSASIDLYVKSKTLAEKAAWDFVRNLPGDCLSSN